MRNIMFSRDQFELKRNLEIRKRCFFYGEMWKTSESRAAMKILMQFNDEIEWTSAGVLKCMKY